MEYIDLKGMSCPLPVIETKKLIEAGSIEELEVSVDQGSPRENVTRFLESRGYRVSVESDQPDSVVLRATKVGGTETTATHIDSRGLGRGNLSSEHGEPGTRLRVREAGYPLAGGALPLEGATGYPEAPAKLVVGVPAIVVLIDGATVGRGDELLGSVLMKSFLHTLKEIEPRPSRLILLNAGVKLASEGSDLVALLKELEALGIEILSCGTCLDFFKLKEKLSVGKVTNMYDIVSSLVAATNVLKF